MGQAKNGSFYTNKPVNNKYQHVSSSNQQETQSKVNEKREQKGERAQETKKASDRIF